MSFLKFPTQILGGRDADPRVSETQMLGGATTQIPGGATQILKLLDVPSAAGRDADEMQRNSM